MLSKERHQTATGPVLAQNLEIFVVEKDSDGVVQRESNVPLSEAEILVGSKPPHGTTGVILDKNSGTVSYTSDTPEDVNERFGGEGPPYIVDARNPPVEPSMKFDAEEEEKLRRGESGEETSDIEFDADEEQERRRPSRPKNASASTLTKS